MKIMILSPFTNSRLRSHLQFSEYGCIKRSIIKRLGLSNRVDVFKDVAPWIGQLIEELNKLESVEVFSVSPHIKLKKRIEHFREGNTTYYFFSSDYSSALRLVRKYRVWKIFQNCSNLVRRIADEVSPDIIISYGTENPVVSISQLYLKKKYPVLCVLQTIYNNPERSKFGLPDTLIQDLEYDIVKNIKYVGTEDDVYCELVKNMNSNLDVLYYPYPKTPLPEIEPEEKVFDFINYAFFIDGRKGDEDSLRALALIKAKHPQVTLNIAGGITPERKLYLENLILELGLEDNVTFTPMFERKEDMYRHVLQARYALLPVKLDVVPTTICESMFYKLPVVTNITSGTPQLNKKKQCVLLAEKDNIESLAECMNEILCNDDLAKQLSTNSYDYILKQMDNSTKIERIICVLKSVIDNYHHKTPIPEQLFYKVSDSCS